jgi:hypothetical protein
LKPLLALIFAYQVIANPAARKELRGCPPIRDYGLR